MVSLIDSQEVSTPTAESGELPDPGVYYARDIMRIVTASDRYIWRMPVSLATARLTYWSNRGLFTLFDPEAGRIRRRNHYASFLGMISVRMIAILRSYGVSWENIDSVHSSLSDASPSSYPLATSAIWSAESLHHDDALDRIEIATSTNGTISLRGLLTDSVAPRSGLEFMNGLASIWRPANGIWINTEFQGGIPCTDGTRVTTSTLWTFHREGISTPEIAEDFELTEAEVKAAIDWHSRMVEVAA